MVLAGPAGPASGALSPAAAVAVVVLLAACKAGSSAEGACPGAGLGSGRHTGSVEEGNAAVAVAVDSGGRAEEKSAVAGRRLEAGDSVAVAAAVRVGTKVEEARSTAVIDLAGRHTLPSPAALYFVSAAILLHGPLLDLYSRG